MTRNRTRIQINGAFGSGRSMVMSKLRDALFALLFCMSLGLAGVSSAQVNFLVPAYANPCCVDGPAAWSQLIAFAGNSPNVGVHVIFNPASGPGLATDPNFVDGLGNGPLVDLREAGGVTYGYVATTFGARPSAEVLADIDLYYDALYVGLLDGVFFDEMSTDLADVGYYAALRDYVKTKDASARVIGNPGVSGVVNPSGQVAFGVTDYAMSMDTIVTFENFGTEYATNYVAPSWVDDFTSDHFAHIVHTQPTWDTSLVALAASRNAGFLFVTDDVLPNPFDRLGVYTAAEVADLVTFNAVQSVPALGGGGLAILAGLLAGVGAWRARPSSRLKV